ncbi:MAG: 30S ribosome-binding factor RbfA [Gemmobacter sp.]
MAQSRFPGTGGPSQRQLRVGETIRRALSEALTRGAVHDPELDRFSITVGEVRTSPDLRVATAFVLPLGGADREAALAALRRNRHELRRIVAQGLTLKFAPELRFALDETFDRMDAARALFQSDVVRRDVAAAGDEDGAAAPGGSDDDAGDPAGRDGYR